MTYRAKLFFALVFTAFISVVLALGINYAKTRELFLEEMRSTVLSIASTTAAFIDGNLLKTIKSPDDENSPAYKKIKRQLQKVRSANRRNDIYIKFVYTLFPSPLHPGEIVFGVDAEEDPQALSVVGDIYKEAPLYAILENIHHPYSPPQFITDQWGVWMTGLAPIYDSAGSYVATIAVDISLRDVEVLHHHLVQLELWAMAAAFLMALMFGLFLSRAFTRSLSIISHGIQEIGMGNLKHKIVLSTKDEFQDLAQAINRMAKGLEERERIKQGFSRYVSQHVLDKILSSDTQTRLEGERRKITVLFSDIRQFNQLTEKLSPEALISLLNEYFEKMMDVIFKNNGTLDKFISDGIMVEFGAPLDDPEQERNALNCAIGMHEELKKLCEKWESQGKPRIDMGIGVHTGPAVVGNIGSERRLEYTAIGDTVNVASRLERATKIFRVPILVSETTLEPVKDSFQVESLGPVELPGRREKITVYAVIGKKNKKEEKS